MEQFEITASAGPRTIQATVDAEDPEQAEKYLLNLFKQAGFYRKVEIESVQSTGLISARRAGLAKGTKIVIAAIMLLLMASCGSTNNYRSNDGLFYKGYKIKANGEHKAKTFIFGRDACQRKNARMQKRRARMSSPDRHPGYGITSMGGARQRR